MNWLSRKIDRWAIKRVMAHEPTLVADLKAELKRTAAWEPHLKAIFIRCLKLLDPKS